MPIARRSNEFESGRHFSCGTSDDFVVLFENNRAGKNNNLPFIEDLQLYVILLCDFQTPKVEEIGSGIV